MAEVLDLYAEIPEPKQPVVLTRELSADYRLSTPCLPRIIRKTIADSIPNITPSVKSERKPIPTTPQLLGDRAHSANIANGGAPPIAPPQMTYVEYLLIFFFLKRK
jgi:hypothetical protein